MSLLKKKIMSSADSAVLAYPVVRPHSPEFSDTLNNHVFIKNVFAPKIPSVDARQIKESRLRNSLEEISKDIREIEDFITVTEDILKRERERDKEFYARERQRKTDGTQSNNKENKSPVYSIYSVKSPTYKRESAGRRTKSGSLSSNKSSKLYFKNGRIGCMDDNTATSNVQETHEIVKNIIKLKRDPSDDSVFLDSIPFNDDYRTTHEYTSKYSSLEDDGYIMDLDDDAVTINEDIVKNACDNLEMVIIDKKNNDDSIQCTAGTVTGSGNGMESFKAAPSSASSAHSNAT